MDPRTYKSSDIKLYAALGLYLLVYALWITVTRGLAIFDSVFAMLFVIPIVALIALVVIQVVSARYRFSGLANIIAFAIVLLMPFLVYLVIASASPAV